MSIFAKIDPKDYVVETFNASAPINWTLTSSSLGIRITDPLNLDGAVVINHANNIRPETIVDLDNTEINTDTGVYKYVLYKSIKHMFYHSASRLVDNNLTPLPDNFFVVSIGQNFYGNKIKETSFELGMDSIPKKIKDDGYGNLYVTESNVGYYVGNIFYDMGIAVIKHNTAAPASSLGQNGINIINGTSVTIDYDSDIEITRHQIATKLNPTQFTYPIFNKSTLRTFTPNPLFPQAYGQFTASMAEQNIPPSSSNSNTWMISTLMNNKVIKPYVTTIGLYTDSYELVAVAKLSRPIQRTFDIPQIFIVRFDT